MILALNRATAQEKGLIWRHLGNKARAAGRWWNLFAVAMAAPRLEKLAKKWTAGMSYGEACYEHFRLIEEFIDAIHRLDLTTPSLFSRLVGAAYDQATGRKLTRRTMREIGIVAEAEMHAAVQRERGDPTEATDNPDQALRALLGQLVEQTRHARDGHRITAEHVTLVWRTRIDEEPLKIIARQLRLSTSNASKQRSRAEMLIAQQLHRPDLAALAAPRRRQRGRGRSSG